MNAILALKSLIRNPPNITTQEDHSPTTTPTSQLQGIADLPAELWSIILRYTVLQLISEDAPPFSELTAALELRLVCRTFSKEVLHTLHAHITLAHLPQTSSTSLLLCSFQAGHKHALFSSAILNTCHTSPHLIASRKLATRLLNCLVIESRLSRADHSESHLNVMMTEELSPQRYCAMGMLRRLCHVAALSSCCQEYMCKPKVFYARYGGDGRRHADVHLEIAVLVACGYEIEWVKRVMVRLARIGRLIRDGDENATRGRLF